MNRYLIATVVLILWGCASMQPPGGGPEDKDAPTILWTMPVKDSVRVGRKVDVQIAFSEKMNHESVEQAVYLSPFPQGEITYGWKKNVLTIRLQDSLESEKTFVVTIGTDAKDNHANSLTQAFSFAFSTGDSLDRGSIAGHVVTENTKGISIWAYRIDDSSGVDSLVYTKRADYITQVGAGGSYQLSYLSPGKYRVFALADLDADYRYTPSSDFVGITSKDITIRTAKLAVTDIDFMMFQEDTITFRMESAVSVDRRLMIAGFSRPLRSAFYFESDSNAVPLIDHFELTDSASGSRVAINDVYLNPANLREVGILTESRGSDRYIITVKEIFSQTGEKIDSEQIVFDGGPDSSDLQVNLELIRPVVKDGYLLQGEFPQFRFSSGVLRNTFEDRFKMVDSLDQKISGEFRWTNSAQVEFRPRQMLASRMEYRIKIASDSVHTWQNRALGDTLAWYSLRSFKSDSLGFVSGSIIDLDDYKSGPYYITCRNVNRSMRDHTIKVNEAGSFMLSYLIPGKYTVVAFRDDDRNGVYSYGRVSPITFSEKFTSYTDTVTVRPNWETSNITVRFKK
jgi:uncharacterized protein (DUF2141 family)